MKGPRTHPLRSRTAQQIPAATALLTCTNMLAFNHSVLHMNGYYTPPCLFTKDVPRALPPTVECRSVVKA